jgi:crotonobetainyl-CoA:carnitine CoA-transferase CaiB-like acyl-CoA transferase
VIPGAVPYGDVIVPYVMAAATAAALERRRHTGCGCHIDAAMYEICVQQMYDAITAAAGGHRPTRTGNDDPAYFHQGVYPARGTDRWIAITLRSEAEWRALAALVSIDPHASTTSAWRHEQLSRWTSTQDEAALMQMLQSHGLAAGVVQDIEDLVEQDPQLAHRSALVELDHPHLGSFGHVRTPITFSRSEIVPFRAPGIGEHSRDIAQLAGLSPERIAELNAQGVFK